MKETTTTTRVCIKNLPTSFDEDALKKFILKESSSSGELKITDCKILRRKTDQQSRKIGFVGFATTSQASYVVSRFHRTYCYTSKLSVEHAIPRNTKNNNNNNEIHHRPWSKYSKGSSQYERIHNKKNDNKKNNDKKEEEEEKKRKERELKKKKEEGDKKKEEFLAAMGIGKSKSRIWENDLGVEQQQEEQQQQNDKQQPLQPTTPTDDDENTNSDEDSIVSNDSTDSEGAGADILKSSSSNNKNKAVVGSVLTDLDFLKSKTSTKDDLESDDDDDDQTATETKDDDSTSSDDSNDSSSSDTSSSSSSSDTEEELRDDDAKNNDDLNNNNKVLDNNEENEKRKERNNESSSSSNLNEDSMMDADDDDDNNEENDPMASNRLFVRNLPFSTTEEELRDYMSYNGGNVVTECHIPIDDMGRNKGYGFVSFDTADTAYQIQEELDGTDFMGRLLHILPARKNTNLEKENLDVNDPTLTYKQKQELIRQKEAQNKKGWSASFVRGDAVVDTLAERLGLRKGDILNVKGNLSSGDAAVRLALGETHVIEENRKYFKDHGIDMEALVSVVSKKKKKGDNDNDDDGSIIQRSSNSILVKNLPFDTEKEDLIKLFGSSVNDPTKILLPPSRTIAFVQYEHNIDAKRAFKKLAYKRYKAVPLYLEWAPSAATTNEKNEDNKKTKENKKIEEEEEETTGGDSNASSFSIYIKNLNFSTTENRLREFFEKHVTVRAVKIPLKVEARRSNSNNESSSDNTKKLSMGFGFVECDSDASVRKALATLQGTVLDGHALDLKRSTKNLGGTTKKKSNTIPKGKNPTKIMCRNVPFQATRKELLQLFGSYGQLKKVRLPKKYDGGHRGFAFVEFLTSNEALSAMNALSRTHLYGRHLVLEWATDMDDIDTLREKSKRDLKIDIHSSSKNKRTKFN